MTWTSRGTAYVFRGKQRVNLVVKYLNVSRIKKYDYLALFTVFFSKVLHNM